MNLTIQIISPHLDDAALSCADHIQSWQRLGHQINVASIFTEFGTEAPSSYMSRFMREQGFPSPIEYGARRREEDLRAMSAMGVARRHCGLCDAGFRRAGGRPMYEDRRALTSGNIGGQESPVLEQAKAALRLFPLPDLVVLPLGVGRHVDHLIAREAGKAVWGGRCALGFYLDLPYARNPLNYSFSACRSGRGLEPSVKWVSAWKREMLDNYRTQMPYLYRHRPRFPEILLTSREAFQKNRRAA